MDGADGAKAGDDGGGRSPDAPPEPQPADLMQINLLTVAWIWGLLPGALTGGVVTYYLWATVADASAEECTSSDCRLAAELLRTALDRSFDPCDDFYSYVCAKFKGDDLNALSKVTSYMQNVTKAMLHIVEVPPNRQSAQQKAAGLYHACVRLALTGSSEVPSLKQFLALVGLDVSDTPTDPDFNIADRIARLSFEYGVPAIVRFGTFRVSSSPKKILEMEIDAYYADWLKRLRSIRFVRVFLTEYDSNLDADRLVRRIIAGESALLQLINRPPPQGESRRYFLINVGGLGESTQPSISKSEWVRLVEKYTDNAYGATDRLVVSRKAVEVISLLVRGGTVSRDDARLLLFWSLLCRLLPLASGLVMQHFELGEYESTCFATVSGVMEAAVMSSYLRKRVPPAAVERATAITHNLMRTLAKKIEATKWIQEPVRRGALEKAAAMQVLVGYTEDVGSTAQMEAFFADFPDASSDFFSPWLQAHRLLTQRLFRNNATENFTAGTANAFYSKNRNLLFIEAGIIQPPVFFAEATAAYNYGGIGQVIGHEIMHGYDVSAITLDAKGKRLTFPDTSTLREYAARVLCLRNSYWKAETERNLALLDHVTDSEGFADYAGILLAHAAYRSLSSGERHAVLPQIGMSAEQTFFVAYCLKWCDLRPVRIQGDKYWAGRSRCVVPLRNMPQFADAFSCRPQAPMNPDKRCPFW